MIMLGVNHAPEFDPLELLENREAGALSAYAVRRDYHDVIKGRLKAFAVDFVARTGAEVKFSSIPRPCSKSRSQQKPVLAGRASTRFW